jgi:hypothetical protein
VDADDAGRARIRGRDGRGPRRPCSYDLEVAASRYLDALSDGEVPLEFLFSGSVFYMDGDALQTTRLSWESEAEYRLPVRVWKETMERYFRGTAWVRLSKDSFDRLSAYKSRNAAGDVGRRAGGARAVSDLLHARRRGHVRGLHALAVPPTALKNQRRWTFGVRLPARVDRASPGRRGLMRTQVLLESDPHDVEVTVRFLQVEGDRAERSSGRGRSRSRAARRRRRRVDGPRLTVTIRNTTPWVRGTREEALRHALCSTHTLLVGGRFVSATEAEGARTSAPGPCWSATNRCSRRRSSSRTIRGSRRSRPGTSSTAARSTGCWPSTSSRSPMGEGGDARGPAHREILERTEALTEEQLWTLSGYRLARG